MRVQNKSFFCCSYINLQSAPSLNPGIVLFFATTVPIFFFFAVCVHNTWRNLCSKQGCPDERTGCSEDLVTELLSCLRSIQRRSSISTRSPRSIPTYKLRFQPQSSARGSEVDATRNFRGAGMWEEGTATRPPPPKNKYFSPRAWIFSGVTQMPLCRRVSRWFGSKEFPRFNPPLRHQSKPVECVSRSEREWKSFCSWAVLPLSWQAARIKPAPQFIRVR